MQSSLNFLLRRNRKKNKGEQNNLNTKFLKQKLVKKKINITKKT